MTNKTIRIELYNMFDNQITMIDKGTRCKRASAVYRLTSDKNGNIDYQTNGNIDTKEGIGNYAYNTTKPHAVSGITNVAPSYSPEAHDLIFTAFNKIQEIEGESESDGQLYRQEFTYGPDRSRKQVETYKDGQLQKSKIYAGGNYEEVINHETGKTKSYHYIHGGSGLAAVFITKEDSAETDNLYYVHKDYLGSILALTNQESTAVERYSFDAWGHRRNPTNWSQWQDDSTDYIVNRGFTGHEHMDIFGLINMNGRVYDPDLGRFISPDPYVQMPDNSQNFNRYSYALNNPLKYTDPSGEFIFTALCAIIPGAQPLLPIAVSTDIGWITGGMRGTNTEGMTFWDGAWRGATVGAVGGTLSMVGGGTFVANVAWGMGEGAITGGLDAALWGNDIGKGMLNGAAIGGAFAAVTSGVEAYDNYRDGHGFRTNEGVIKKYINNNQYQDAIDYIQNEYGMLYDYQGNRISMKHQTAPGAYGDCSPNGDIRIDTRAFTSPSKLKETIVHEYSHNVRDRVLDASGNFIDWQYPVGSYSSSNAILRTDGPIGYANSIYNAGKLHIKYSVTKNNLLWDNWNRSIKWKYLIPKRFNITVKSLYY